MRIGVSHASGIGTTAPTGGQLHVANSAGDAIFAESAAMNGRGVFGLGSAATPISFGVYGQSTSSDGIGVYGTGTTRGGYFTSADASGRGPDGRLGRGHGKAWSNGHVDTCAGASGPERPGGVR